MSENDKEITFGPGRVFGSGLPSDGLPTSGLTVVRHTRWMLCPSAQAKARETDVVQRCAGRRDHQCDGPRTPYLFSAYVVDADGDFIAFLSDEPCCSSCMTDREFGEHGGNGCCCVHETEFDDMVEERSRQRERLGADREEL